MATTALLVLADRRGASGPTWPVFPGLVLMMTSLVVILGAVAVRWSDVRGIKDRKQVLERALGARWSRITTWMLWGGIGLSFLGIAVMGALQHSG